VTSYSWDFGDGNSSTEADPAHTFTSAGVYTVTLTVTDAAGEENTDTIEIVVTGNSTMTVVLQENPVADGMMTLNVLNKPADVDIISFSIHDVGGRYVFGVLANPTNSTADSFAIPVYTLGNGLYFVSVNHTQGKPILVKLLMQN